MSTLEIEEPPEPTRTEAIASILGNAMQQATDTGPATGINLRTWLLIVMLGAVVSLSGFPLNLIGSVTLLALTLTLASRVRGTR